MDQSAVAAIVGRHLGRLQRLMGLEHWQISCSYEHQDPCDRAVVSRLTDYNRAEIDFNPMQLGDEDDVLGCLRHELFHLVLAPFDVYSRAVEAAVRRNRPLSRALDSAWTHADEQAVANLERMWERLHGKTARRPASRRKGSRAD